MANAARVLQGEVGLVAQVRHHPARGWPGSHKSANPRATAQLVREAVEPVLVDALLVQAWGRAKAWATLGRVAERRVEHADLRQIGGSSVRARIGARLCGWWSGRGGRSALRSARTWVLIWVGSRYFHTAVDDAVAYRVKPAGRRASPSILAAQRNRCSIRFVPCSRVPRRSSAMVAPGEPSWGRGNWDVNILAVVENS